MIQEDQAAATTLLENLIRIIGIVDSDPVDEEDNKEESTRVKKKGAKKKKAPTT